MNGRSTARLGILFVLASFPLFALEPTSSSKLPAGHKSDFLNTPVVTREELKGVEKAGKGTLQISYQDGKITHAQIIKTTGSSELDAVACRHVQKFYQVRKGATGVVTMPFHLDGTPIIDRSTVSLKEDFSALPKLPGDLPYHLRRNKNASLVEVEYANGVMTNVFFLTSTGSKELDDLIIRHIQNKFKVKPGRNGLAFMPVVIGRRN